MPHAQLMPARAPAARWRGVGSGISDFDSLVANLPGAGNAWNDVASQLASEFASQDTIGAAKIAFTDAVQQQISSSLGVNAEDAIGAAKQYVLAGQTVAGAVNTVGGLIGSAGSMPPAQVVQAFTGTMIGAAATLGAVSAGIGAAIVGAVSIVVSLLQQAGLFGSPPAGVEVCPGFFCNPTPNWTLNNCVCVWGDSALPGTFHWRDFPSPAGVDVSWATGTTVSPWNGLTIQGRSGTPLIYQAFPIWWNLTCEQERLLPGAAGDFQKAFLAAWKSNAAYAINGLKPQPDWAVLMHTARMWNRSHEPDGGYDFLPADKSNLSYYSGPGQACPYPVTTYESVLVNDLQSNLQKTDPLFNGGNALHINTGPMKSAKFVQGVAGSGTGTLASVALGGAVAVGVAAGGLGAYAYVTRQPYMAVLRSLWRSLV